MNRFNIGEKVQHKPLPNEHTHTHNTIIIHRYAIELARLILFKTFLHRTATKEAAEGWERKRERQQEIEVCELQWPCPCISAPAAQDPSPPCDTPSIGDSSVWRTVFVLYCYWWHFGVTVSWWNGSPPTSQPAAAQLVEQWGPEELGLELRRPQLGATP